MPTEHFTKRSTMPVSAEALFDWHARSGAFERLTPPWEPVELLSRSGGIENGARTELGMRMGPLRLKWIAEHRNYQPKSAFQDVQLAGPFAKWEHTHRMLPGGAWSSILEDAIDYELPGGPLGRYIGNGHVRQKLQRVFEYRHRVTAADVAAHQRFQNEGTMQVLVSGSTGLVGSQLVPFLTTGGHGVTRLVRRASAGDKEIRWDPQAGTLAPPSLDGIDAVVHLAGENIAAGRWSDTVKRRIRDSRVEGTRLLASALAAMPTPPKVLVCASAIGYYGNRGDEELDEHSPAGDGFLADVCREWEASADPARDKGIRVVHLRFGVVLSPRGGALQKMLTPFKLGAGGVIGSGRQWWSWIALDDVIGAVHHALMTEAIAGPVNCVAPHPVTNREFTKTLGRVLGRPTLFPMPAFAARLALGEMADELLLASARVAPQRLQETGYDFRYPHLEPALRHLLGK